MSLDFFQTSVRKHNGGSFYHLPFRILMVSLYFALILAQPTPLPEITQMVDFTERHKTWITRLFSVDTSSKVTRAIRGRKEDDAMVQPAFDYIDSVWGIVKKRRDANHSLACNLYELGRRDWPRGMRDRAEIFQLGFIDRSCFSQVDVTKAAEDGEISSSITKNAHSIFTNAHKGFQNTFAHLRMVPDTNWSTGGKVYNMTSRVKSRSGQNCLISSIFAHRMNKIWYLRAVVTNKAVSISAPPYQRHFLQEFVPRNGTQAITMTLANIDSGKIERGTTVVEKWGRTGFSVESNLFDDPLDPLYKAYQNSIISVDMASDAITGSNIAILALPMVMNLIPIAFIAEIHSVGILAYTIVTDVFSTIPFLIKGFELIQSARPKKTNVFAYFSGNETLGSMQSWSVQCTGQEQFRSIGIVFVVFGTFAIVVGVGLECWAKRYMYRKRISTNYPDDVVGPFGKPYVDYFSRRNNKIRSSSTSGP